MFPLARKPVIESTIAHLHAQGVDEYIVDTRHLQRDRVAPDNRRNGDPCVEVRAG